MSSRFNVTKSTVCVVPPTTNAHGSLWLTLLALALSCSEPTASSPLPDGGNAWSTEMASKDAAPPADSCTSGERRCAVRSPEVCTENGTWHPLPACAGESPRCFEGECVVCVPDAVQCVNNAPHQCSSTGHEWVEGEACGDETPSCIQETGKCGRCAEGARQCDGDTPQVCDGEGRWTLQDPCAGDTPKCLTETGSCVACNPNETPGNACASDSQPRVCNDQGEWVLLDECGGDTPSCITQTGQCGCAEGSKRCNGDPELCEAGSWTPLDACSGDEPVCDVATGDCVCDEGTKICDEENRPKGCINKRWEQLAACAGDTPVCDASNGNCVCENGTRHCSGEGLPELCNDSKWRVEAACALNTVCVDGACSCNDGDRDCDGSRARVCVEGSWVVEELCNESTRSCADGECKCLPNEDGGMPIQHELWGCAVAQDTDADTDLLVVFDSGVYLDTGANIAWAPMGGFLSNDAAMQFCSELELGGVDWRLPTIDEVRTLVAGCPTAIAGGTCDVGDTCAALTCASTGCERATCPLGEGPGTNGRYLRPNVPIEAIMQTSTVCSDCEQASIWIFNPTGYLSPIPVTDTAYTVCALVQ